MNEPARTQWQIRCAFNGYCKGALKNKTANAHRDTKRQQIREVTFSDLSPQEENQLYTYNRYFADDEAEQSFCVAGKEITAKLLAEVVRLKLFTLTTYRTNGFAYAVLNTQKGGGDKC